MKDLFEDHEAYARKSDPKTSHDAAAGVDTTKREAQVYVGIWGTKERGATWHELESLTNIDKASISPRFKPLMRKRLVTELLDADGLIVTRMGAFNRQQRVLIATCWRKK